MNIRRIIYTFILTTIAIKVFGLMVAVGIKGSGVFEKTDHHELKKRSSTQHPCSRDSQCGTGICKEDGQSNEYYCQCDDGWIDDSDGNICAYEQKSELVAFLVSFFVGEFGVDWFYLARGNANYIVAGVFKILTIGCCGIWWLVDWIRILAGSFDDGNGIALNMNM